MTTVDPNRLGPYQIIRELGRGGMGVVRLARDTRLDRVVAIKSLPSDLASDPDRMARFEREARSLAQLNHPNVAAVYGLEDFEGQKYLVMEFVDGQTLASRLDRGPLGIDEAIEIGIEITRGIEAAHGAGVIHRDLKPDNIAITPDARVKILDFGLAKSIGTDPPSDISALPTLTTPRSPTIPGAIMGTAGYMSPEQARGRPVDKRTDVWAFGAVLYQMLTGVNPFAGETVHDTIGAVLHREVGLDALPRGTPPQVRRVITRCLQRDKDKRLHDIADARLELEEARSGIGTGSTEAKPGAPANRAIAWTGWVAAAIALAAVAWLALSHRPSAPALVRTAVLAPEGLSIEEFQLSPDGKRISIAALPVDSDPSDGPRVRALYIRELDREHMQRVPRSEGTLVHRVSPDGRTIAFISRGADNNQPLRLLRVPSDLSSQPVVIMEIPPECQRARDSWLAWTPRGELSLFDMERNALVIIDAGTGRELRRIPITSDLQNQEVTVLVGPFGPQHLRAVHSEFSAGHYRENAVVIDIDSGRMTQIAEDSNIAGPTPGGSVLFTRQNAVCAAPFDIDRMAMTGPIEVVQSGLGYSAGLPNGDFAIASDGTLAYMGGNATGTNRQIVRIDRAGHETPWSTEKQSYEVSVAVSPDGKRLASIISTPGGIFEIWGAEVDRPRFHRIYALPDADCYRPIFTPDGSRVILTRIDPKTMSPDALVIVRFDGSDARNVPCDNPPGKAVFPLSVSADASHVLVLEQADVGVHLREVNLHPEPGSRVLMRSPNLIDAAYPPTDLPLIAYSTSDAGPPRGMVTTLTEKGLGASVPLCSEPVATLDWVVDDKLGLCILHFDNTWKEWITPVAYENGVIRVGDSVLTGRIGNELYDDRATTLDGSQFAIRKGEDERPPTHIELVQGWVQSVDNPRSGAR